MRTEAEPAGPDLFTASVAIPTSIVLVLWVKTHTQLAFPWYVSLGALTTAGLVEAARLFGKSAKKRLQVG